jgi:hypothetical protein
MRTNPAHDVLASLIYYDSYTWSVVQLHDARPPHVDYVGTIY